jgi:hypothetical protein
VGGLLVIPLSLTPGLCLGVSGPLISPLWVPPFGGLLNTGHIVGFNAVAGTRSGHHFAFAVGHRATLASCGEGRSLLVGHTGQTVSCRMLRAGGRSIPGRGGHLACSEGRSHHLNAFVASGVAIRSVDRRAFEPEAGPSRATAATLRALTASSAASILLWHLA